MNRNNENGFSTPFAMSIIFILSLILFVFCMMIYSSQKVVLSYQRKSEFYKKAENLLKAFQNDIQSLKECENDNVTDIRISGLYSKYATYGLTMADISTGINKRFLKAEILENTHIKQLIEIYGEDIQTEYGWINPQCSNEKVITEIEEDFDSVELFPLINNMSIYNVNFMNRDFIEAILKLCNIANIEEKMNKIEKLKNEGNYKKEELIRALGLQQGMQNFLGTKTAFWKIKFYAYGYEINAIFAAVPEKSNSEKISEYILIEKNISYGGKNE